VDQVAQLKRSDDVNHGSQEQANGIEQIGKAIRFKCSK